MAVFPCKLVSGLVPDLQATMKIRIRSNNHARERREKEHVRYRAVLSNYHLRQPGRLRGVDLPFRNV